MPDPSADTLFECLLATWPPAEVYSAGPWMISRGEGGGQRVSAARAVRPVQPDQIALAETAMREIAQRSLFLIRDHGDTDLDSILAKKGYLISDPTVFFSCPIDRLAGLELPPVSAFSIWPPLQIMRDLWAAGGTGPERVQIMERAGGPKTAILGRSRGRAGGVGFVAMQERTAMVHALEVSPDFRRSGLGTHMLVAAAQWAAAKNARHFALAVTRANAPALALYRGLGMAELGGYHYRVAPTDP